MALHEAEYESLTTLSHEVSLMHRLSQSLHEALVDGRYSKEQGRIILFRQPLPQEATVQKVRVQSKG